MPLHAKKEASPPADSTQSKPRGKARQTGKRPTVAGSNQSEPTPKPPSSSEPEPAEWASLSPAVKEVLALFAERQAELRFPGVDADVLNQLVSELAQAEQQTDEARKAYERSQAAHRELEAALTELARTAFSYARVYASRDAELQQQLSQFSLAAPSKTRARKRGRSNGSAQSRKNPSLPFAEDNAAPVQTPAPPTRETEVVIDEELQDVAC